MNDVAVVTLFARLRWLMLRGALRSDGAQRVAVVVGLIGSTLLGAIAAASVFVLGRTSDDVEAVFVAATTASVLVVTMLSVIAGVTQPVDPRVVATEPLARRQLGIGLLAASAAGPPGLSAALVGIGLFTGAVRGPASIVPVLLAVSTFLATLLLVSRTTINVLGLLSNRYPRAGQLLVGVASLVFYAAFQIVPRALADLDDGERGAVVDAAGWTPMGQLGRALAEAGQQPVLAVVHVALGALWLPVLLWVFTASTRHLIESVKGGSGARSARQERRRRPISALARRLCGPGASGAAAWRSILTRFRTPRTALETFTGAGVGLAIVLVPALSSNDVGAGAVLVGGAVQVAVLFIAGNSFGSDGPALANELLTGVDPKLLVAAKARAVTISAGPLALVGPLIATAITGEWRYLPAGVAIGVGGLFAGAGAAMVQSSFVPIAVPDSDNPLASGDGGKGWFSALMLGAVLLVLAVLTLPVALALLWALQRQSVPLVTVLAVVTLGAGLLVERGGVALATTRWRSHGPELYAEIIPAR
jgi:ABC-2 type transport system permease protein